LAYVCTGVVFQEWSKCLRGKRTGAKTEETLDGSRYSIIVDNKDEIHRIKDAHLSINSSFSGYSLRGGGSDIGEYKT